MGASSLEMHSRQCIKGIGSRILPQHLAIHKQTQCVKDCTKQWLIFQEPPPMIEKITTNKQQNLKCKEYDYAVGHEVLIKAVNPAKLEPKAHGSYA
eukprot:7259344-Ditylum_brightwellii.AAC.1